MGSFEELTVWQRSHCQTTTVYEVTKAFPHEELFGITNQMRRVASSIGCNLAEGTGRQHRHRNEALCPNRALLRL
jgi:four helix bundle protein